jgi:hypothetical protein
MPPRSRLVPFFLTAALLPGALGPSPRLAAAPAHDLAPKRVAIQKKAISLSDALAEVKKQTGLEVLDKRRTRTNPRLSLDIQGATFWEAVDRISAAARAPISLYEANGQVALVDGAYRRLPVSYSGLFRTVVKRIVLTRDLDAGAHYAVVHLEVAWEPRLEPFYLDLGPTSVSYPDAAGKQVAIDMEGKGQIQVHGRNFLEFTVRFPAPDRSMARLKGLAGKLTLVTPSRMLTFTFGRLGKIDKAGLAQKQEQDGVTVRLNKLLPGDDPLDVEVALAYPAEGPKFESYQSWLVNNDIYLARLKGGAPVRPLPGGMEIDRSTYPNALIRYHFDNKKNRFGNLKDWKLVYRTPGRIVSLPLQFAFKDLPLP